MPARVSQHKNYANYLEKGSNNVLCDRSGMKFKASECRYEWNGLFVYKGFWEARQPQDLLKGFPDNQEPEVSRPGGEDVFLTANEVKADDL